MSEATIYAATAVLPFLSFLIALAIGDRLPKRGAGVGILAMAGSLGISLYGVAQLLGSEKAQFYSELHTWAAGESAAAAAGADGTIELVFGVLLDPLSALMLVIVSLVSLLVHIFSLGYMNDEGETGLPRYYAGLGLFSASMLAFVFSSNLLMAFIFFELVGLCSYLLIGFWFREDAPPSAAKKAFLVTRFGDYFFLVGVVGILATFGTTAFFQYPASDVAGFPQLAEQIVTGEATLTGPLSDPPLGLDATGWLTTLGLLVLGGVIGKSAQFPLHTWLPDAMEGPTPVSALIHAATMVAAGVYLVARMFGFYALLPTALAVIAFVGGFTALFAATMGVVKNDIKQVLAYSTISQYGYMMLALGVGGYVAGVFHLLTHAFFKALLFLGAGAVIIATHHEQDMWKMGGLKERLPVTYWTYVAGSLALAGIVPFAGFWSKDEVLYDALHVGLGEPIYLAAYAMGLLAVFFTGFYTIRMVRLTFHGEPRSEHARDAHELGLNVKFPLGVLGVLATVTGLVNMKPVAKVLGLEIEFLKEWLNMEGTEGGTLVKGYGELIKDVAGLTPGMIGSDVTTILLSAGLSLGLALAGAATAWRLYGGPEPEQHTTKLGAFWGLASRNYYQDEFQVWLATGVTQPIARACAAFDQVVIDGLVNGTSSVSLAVGDRTRRIQTGTVTTYAALIVLGLLALLIAFGVSGGWLL
jgi:NADH-quinone oxidoreductase subunit L